MVSRPGTWLFITTCFLAQQVDLCFQLHSLERSVGWWVFWGFFCLWVSSLQLVCRSLLVNCHVPAAEIWGVLKKASPFFFFCGSPSKHSNHVSAAGRSAATGNAVVLLLPLPLGTVTDTHVHTRPHLPKWKRWCELFSPASA